MTMPFFENERRLSCPVLVLWSRCGLGSLYDVLGIWREEADDVKGRALEGGHFLAEESPDAVISELLTFLERPSTAEA